MYRFIVFKGLNSRWYWHLLAPNNQRIAASGEGFTTRASAIRSAQLVKQMAGWSPIL